MKKKFNLKNWNRILLLAGVLLFVISPFVSALSVGGIEDEVKMYPGQIWERGLLIQNRLGGGNAFLEGKIEKGTEVVSFSGSNKVDVPFGEDVSVYLTLEVPANAAIGTKYPVRVMFNPISGEGVTAGGGSMQFSIAVGKEFNVLVVEKPANLPAEEEKKTGANVWPWVLVGILVLIAIAWWFLKKKK